MPFNIQFMAQTPTEARRILDADVAEKKIPNGIAVYMKEALDAVPENTPVSVVASGYLPDDPTPSTTCHVEIRPLEFRKAT